MMARPMASGRCWSAACLLPAVMALAVVPTAQARTVFRCVQAGTVSLSTAPEPGAKCEAHQIDDNAVQTPNLWGAMGVFSGTLYEREQDGKLVYGTRNLPGSRVYLKFTVQTLAPTRRLPLCVTLTDKYTSTD